MRDSRFALLSFGTILLITLSCYVEEWIFKQLPGFNFHWFVALVELAVFALLGAACEQSCSLQLRTELRKGPLGLYLGTGLSLAASTGLGKLAFRYLNYATGTILKSMKLLPVMLISVLWLRRRYGAQEYISAVLMVTSAALFGLGERSVEPDFSPIGLGLALCVLLSQAIQTNLQVRSDQLGSDSPRFRQSTARRLPRRWPISSALLLARRTACCATTTSPCTKRCCLPTRRASCSCSSSAWARAPYGPRSPSSPLLSLPRCFCYGRSPSMPALSATLPCSSMLVASPPSQSARSERA